MATLANTLPTYAFPHELDNISIEAGGEASCAVVIKIGGTAIYSSTLFFDDNDFAEIECFADVIRSYVTTQAKTLEIMLDGASVGSCTILPCSVDLDTEAERFCPDHFLTLCGRRKTTTLDAQECLCFYSPEAGVVISVMAVYYDKDGKVKTEKVYEETSANTGRYTYSFDVADFAAKCAGQMIGFTVTAGERSMEYIVKTAVQSAEQLRFDNAFGCAEYLGFVEVESKLQTKYSNARFRGVLRTYKTEQYHEYKYHSGYMIADEIGVFEDLAAAKNIVRMSDNLPLTVTASDFNRTTDIYEPIRCNITLRESGRGLTAKTTRKVRTFDKTFDSTFE